MNVIILSNTMYNKIYFVTVMSMLSNQGLGKYMYYQPRPFTVSTTLIIPDVTKTLSNNKLFIVVLRNLNFIIYSEWTASLWSQDT